MSCHKILILMIFLTSWGLAAAANATDLYLVRVGSQAEAEALSQSGTEAVLQVTGGYLVLTDDNGVARLAIAGLGYELIAKNVDRYNLALDIRHDMSNAGLYPVVYKDGETRLLQVDPSQVIETGRSAGLAALPGSTKIFYKEPAAVDKSLMTPDLGVDLDSLVNLVLQDSLESYSYWLEAYRGRAAGSNYGPACDLRQKFYEFGYDSVYLQEFWRPDHWGYNIFHGWNVVATKVGTEYPLDHIILGAHFDTEAISPGADDNGSGTAAVLEIARVLRDIDTKMSIVFILFDCEEEGLLGAFEYAEAARANKERIPFMLNMDMIAERRNSTDAKLYHGTDTTFAAIWSRLADSLPSININGHLSGPSSGSDHRPFLENGYDVVFVHEYVFSTVYHTARDSTTYMNFDYMTRMVKASLATAYYVDGTYIPPPALILSFPEGIPDLIAPGVEDTVRVHIDEYAGGVLIPNSVSLNYSMNGGPNTLLPMTNLGGGDFEVALPPMICGDLIQYHVMAAEATLECVYHHPDPDFPAYSIMTSSKRVILDDNFETDLGWTVGGDATTGQWERYRAASNTAFPKSDFDFSGRCFITDHGLYEDVDHGSTLLLSPPFDVSRGKTFIEYAYWYDNGTGLTGKSDVFRVSVFDGMQWIVVDTAGPEENASGTWEYVAFWLNDYCTPTGMFQIRFDASDAGFDSNVEAAVDAVRFTYYSIAPEFYTSSLPDVIFGNPIDQWMEAGGCYEPMVWSDKNDDLSGTGLSLSGDGHLSGVPNDTGVISFTAMIVDGEGVSNEKTFSFHVWLSFVCGDAGMDYQLNVGDAVFLINFVFKGGPAPYPLCVGDANGDDEANVGDAVYLINHIFKGGPAPLEGCCF